MLIYQSRANFDEKILFRRIAHLQDPTIRKMPVRGLYGTREFQVPFESMIYVALKFALPVGDTKSEFQKKVNHGPEWNVEFLFQSMSRASICLISRSIR